MLPLGKPTLKHEHVLSPPLSDCGVIVKLLRRRISRMSQEQPSAHLNDFAVHSELLWLQGSPFVLLGREEFAASPAELMYEENHRLSGDLVLDKRGDRRETRFLSLLQ